MTENFDEKIKKIVGDYLKQSAFKDRKLTDTPTDALQVVPKKYVDSKITHFGSTLANVTNTNTETTVLSFTVPGNTMLDGDTLEITLSFLFKNNSGSTHDAIFILYYGSLGATIYDGTGTNTYSNNATERNQLVKLFAQRVGNDLWVSSSKDFNANGFAIDGADIFTMNMSAISSAQVITPDFTTSQTIAFKVTLDTADPLYYFKPQSAKVMKI